MLSLRKKILVAIDGSPMSDKAAEEAVRLAAGNQAQFKSKVYAMIVLPNAPRTTFTDFVPPTPITETEQWGELRNKIFYVVEKSAWECFRPGCQKRKMLCVCGEGVIIPLLPRCEPPRKIHPRD